MVEIEDSDEDHRGADLVVLAKLVEDVAGEPCSRAEAGAPPVGLLDGRVADSADEPDAALAASAAGARGSSPDCHRGLARGG